MFSALLSRSAIFLEVLLFFDAVAIARYFYIFRLKNPAAFNDDFWSWFFNLWIKSFALLSQASWHLLVERQPMSYYVCTGQDPTETMKHPLRFGEQQLLCVQFDDYATFEINNE